MKKAEQKDGKKIKDTESQAKESSAKESKERNDENDKTIDEDTSKENNPSEKESEMQDEANSEKKEVSEEKKELSWEEKYKLINDKYLRLSAEYDNYRKRTLKEKMDLIKSAGSDILINFLSVTDNLDRAKKSINASDDMKSMKEGLDLIFKGLNDFLQSRGIKEIEAQGNEFDTDLHEAVTKIPAPEKKLKGKVVDVIEKGYTLNGQVLRYAKVVIGE
ncbi:MAG: nucleotide exchange factor GrpE [Bacteroidota bacterium]|nr:nucleotide exchange factor GrpE [Bacteroidota bacterium]